MYSTNEATTRASEVSRLEEEIRNVRATERGGSEGTNEERTSERKKKREGERKKEKGAENERTVKEGSEERSKRAIGTAGARRMHRRTQLNGSMAGGRDEGAQRRRIVLCAVKRPSF